MNRLNWILLAVGVVGLITAVILMRKKGSCSCSDNLVLEEIDLGDGQVELVNAVTGQTEAIVNEGDIQTLAKGGTTGTSIEGKQCRAGYVWKCYTLHPSGEKQCYCRKI